MGCRMATGRYAAYIWLVGVIMKGKDGKFQKKSSYKVALPPGAIIEVDVGDGHVVQMEPRQQTINFAGKTSPLLTLRVIK